MKSVLTLGILLTGRDMLSPVLGKTEKKLGKLEHRAKQVGKIMTASATAGLAGSMVIGNSIKSMVNSYQELAVAQGEVKSLGIDPDGIAIISNEATKFSNKFAGTTAPQFVSASYSIKSGISSLSDTGVAEFTRLSALTGKATLSTTSQMTSLFATGYGIYRKQFEQFGAKSIEGWKGLSKEARDIKFAEYFSAGIAGAVQAFKTNGNQMQSAIEALGATATTSNVPLKEQLAILGLLQKTKSGSESATMYRAFLTSAGGASKKLKLQFLDSNNQLKSTPKLLEQLRKKYGKTLDDLEKQELKKAFGTDEAMAFITMFYNGVDELNQNIDLMGSKMRLGTKDVLTMAEAMNQGREFELLDQKIGNLTSLIGKQFAPIALKVATIIGKVTTNLTEWTEAHPELTENIATAIASGATFIGVLAALTIGVKTASFAMGVLGMGSKKSSSLLGKAVDTVGDLRQSTRKPLSFQMGMKMPKKKTMLGKVGSLLGGLSRFALANPIVLGVVMSGAAFYTAYSLYKKTLEKDVMGQSEKYIALAKKEEQQNKPLALRTTDPKQAALEQKRIEQRRENLDKKGMPTTLAEIIFKKEKTLTMEEIHTKMTGQKENSFLSSLTPVKKEITNNKEVQINAPINITVHAVEGKAPIKEIARAVENSIKRSTRSENNNISHLDEEI